MPEQERLVLPYIEPGVCNHSVRACLAKVTAAGTRRYIFVKVYVQRPHQDLIAAIAHELQHAIEVLGDPTVKDLRSLYRLYRHLDTVGGRRAFETTAAIQAGEAVADEIRARQRRPDTR